MDSKENSAWLTFAKCLGMIFVGTIALLAEIVGGVIGLIIFVLTKKKR